MYFKQLLIMKIWFWWEKQKPQTAKILVHIINIT